MPIECPKCGRSVDAGAFICPGCDFILDASFLGDDITDDERDQRPAAERKAPTRKKGEARVDFGEDAMILGDVNDQEVSSFKSRDAGVHQREVTQARFYLGGAIAQLMQQDAIPEVASGVAGASIRMTPFERHVLTFVNGKRSVGRIQKKSAMDESEFKTALAMLADKGFIRLRGFKKPKSPSSQGSALGSQISQVVVRPTRSLERRGIEDAPAPERTVVASMEHIEAQARADQAARAANPRAPRPFVEQDDVRSPVPEVSSQLDTPVEPRANISTRVVEAKSATSPPPDALVTAPGPSPDAAPAPSRRFTSLQADLPESDGESYPALGPPGGDEPDPLKVAAQSAWDAADNQSSVFADSEPQPAAPKPPETAKGAPSVSDADDGVFGDPSGFDDVDVATGGFAALKDPTGIGDSLLSDGAGGDGAPVDDEDDADDQDDADGPGNGSIDEDDEPASFASAEQLPSSERDAADLGPPRRIHDEVTAPPRPAVARRGISLVDLSQPGDEDEHDGPTAQFSPVKPMTLPSEALSPVVASPAPEAPPAPLPQPQQPPTPPPSTTPRAAGGPAGAAEVPPAVAPPMALPGRSLLSAAAAAQRPAAPKPPAPTRVSAASQVPFELRKKAEKIYEQALKDHAEGRQSSAMMNAKLAMNFDPTVDAYRELFEELTAKKSAPAPKAGPRPQELVLFEQANEAEGRGDYQKAVTLLEQAVALNPKAAALHNKLGVVLSIRLKRHDEALAHLKRAIELEPGSIVYMNNFSKVTGLLESMIQKDPKRERKRGDGKADEKVNIKVKPKRF